MPLILDVGLSNDRLWWLPIALSLRHLGHKTVLHEESCNEGPQIHGARVCQVVSVSVRNGGRPRDVDTAFVCRTQELIDGNVEGAAMPGCHLSVYQPLMCKLLLNEIKAPLAGCRHGRRCRAHCGLLLDTWHITKKHQVRALTLHNGLQGAEAFLLSTDLIHIVSEFEMVIADYHDIAGL